MAVRNIKLTINYDGINYGGWQRQPDKQTIQGEIERALESLTGAYVKVKGTSRTDAGVSALGQIANIIIDSPIPTENFVEALNHRLPRDIVVTEAAEVDLAFESSGCAKSKLYRYTVFTGKRRNAIETRNCWHRVGQLNINAMNEAAKMLEGTHDFKSFAAAADERENSVRTVIRCEVMQNDKWIYVEIEADRFLYNMVRNIVGTLVEIGKGRWMPEKINEILAACSRCAAGPTAPAEGLCLVRIDY